ncbi:protein bicaudal C [Contarinia nasturtii]|uniref:protein bicaudal C n=1 Tax=Contarinia nasturtii TaxID=265458 RepID=UPI0012D4BA00|nr:protein bicaudal C [Contarinia nasturtii]XP_031619045.1 protein bicaudal C [Contarinia nasturtii]XP_031619046.1 protein bicaudal C [Contarinia nasturtii]
MGPDGNNNLLNNLMYRNVRQSSESQSEASSSAESDWSDINSIAAQMGLHPKDLCVERFKVDRNKLETLIKDASPTEGMNAAECFFDNVIKMTGTRISWPCRLKIGAKTKKDPHVRIVGKNSDVMKAKEQILNRLDSRGCRVIMKMDISYTDHSYIIGRCGNNIKKIMEDTMTHIHFPDSNRSSQTEKSNQVSLCGSLEGVEKARALVRLSTPLIISYELPMSVPGHPIPDNNTEYVKEAEATYNVQVKFSSRPKLNSSVVVKGSEKEAEKVQDAARQLCLYMCGNPQIQVNLQLRISPQHHDIVKGKHNVEVRRIMEYTNTKIIFPDLSDANIKQIEKSLVTITGTIDGVYRARQQLIGNLPVALIFDYPENSVKQEDINALMEQFGVFIAARHKQRQSTLCIVIKGIEKYVGKIYEARHKLLNLPKSSIVEAEIPATYYSSAEPEYNTSALVEILSSVPNSPLTPGGLLQNFTPTFPNPSFHNQLNRVPDFASLTPENLRFHALQQQALQQQVNGQNIATHLGLSVNPSYSPAHASVSPRSSSTKTSGYHSNKFFNISGSANSLEQLYPPYKPSIQINGNGVNHFPHSDNQIFVGNSTNLTRQANVSNESSNHPFEMENRLLTPSYHSPRSLEFERQRIEGLKAIDRFDLNREQVRIPTDAWAKFSLSKTSPFALESASAGVSQWAHREKLHFDKAATTGLIDSVPWNDRVPLSQFKDMHSLLSHLKLEHYISNFVVEKIDIKMFATLTGEDLLELNINALGPRKKLLLAIKQLKAETQPSPPSSEWVQLSDFKDIPSLFTHLEMKHHIENFLQNEIDMKTFLTLTTHELAELGVKSFIERKRLLMAINQLKSERFAGSAAPGAERRSSAGLIPEPKLFHIS